MTTGNKTDADLVGLFEVAGDLEEQKEGKETDLAKSLRRIARDGVNLVELLHKAERYDEMSAILRVVRDRLNPTREPTDEDWPECTTCEYADQRCAPVTLTWWCKHPQFDRTRGQDLKTKVGGPAPYWCPERPAIER